MYKKSKIINRILYIVILTLFSIWTVFPILLVVSNSFKVPLDIKAIPPVIFFKPIFSHYEKVLLGGDFLRYFLNSLLIAGGTTVISVMGGAMGAYGLLISKSKWSQGASNIMLVGKTVPAITILIPFYMILNSMHLGGGYIGPILAHSSTNLPFVVWLMYSFMVDVPKSLFDAASIDGTTRMGTFWKIMIPLLKPAMGSAVILSMQYSWNELVYSLQLTSMRSYTLPVGIGKYVGAVAVDWGKSSAAATITMVPIIIVGFLMQKHLVSGLSAGAVKG